MSIHISVVSPVYGHELRLDELCSRLIATLSTLCDEFEIILVNDQSPDDAWSKIVELAAADQRIRGINLSRNFGQHFAVTAGLDYARGDWCVVMDCDLQDVPEEIPKLYTKAQDGYDMVLARRAERQDSFLVKFYSKAFYLLFNYLTDQKLDNGIANFGIYSKPVIEQIKRFKERDRSFGLLASIVGYRKAIVDVIHSERPAGRSGYDFRKRLQMATNHILSHSNKPLRLAVRTGFMLSSLAFLYAFYIVISYFAWGQSVSGWSSLIVSLFFLSGVTISIVGLVGLYVGKIYNEVKNRPLYIIMATTDD